MDYTLQKLLDEHNEVFSSFDKNLFENFTQFCDVIEQAVRDKNLIMFMGNGGSSADAHHIAAEFVCKFDLVRTPWPAMALSADSSIVTSIGNDFGYDQVFARQITAYAQRGSVVVGLSTSGKSANVLAGIREANKLGLTTVSITGQFPNPINSFSKVRLQIPSPNTARIQEATTFILHALMTEVERRMF